MKLGAEGKLTQNDDGEIKIAIGVHKNKVTIHFTPSSPKSSGLNKESALKIAGLFIKCAQEIKED